MDYVYNVDDRCDAKVTTRSNLSYLDKVYDALDEVHKEMFLKSCFGKLYEMRNSKISAQLIHNLLLRRVVSVNKDELWFCLGDKKAARFSLYEFTLITGLNPAHEKEYQSQINESNRLANKYFSECDKVTPKELDEAFEEERTDMDEKYKLGLVLIYETVLRCGKVLQSQAILYGDFISDLVVYQWATKDVSLEINNDSTSREIAKLLDDPKVPSISHSRRSPYRHQASCNHDDILRQLLLNMEMLNRKVDTIMNRMRPNQHLGRDHSFGVHGVSETEYDNVEEVGRRRILRERLGASDSRGH
ncbi:hypothetical protein DH2020_030922 [Rehmannia glutinosa]|uniref:DUF1985 domain-containing protein n=1 Tax=Rehmannia glutinosa TaxID=99300 RepID=A0ABR0VMY1_REHGL